jgi:hypothetical protein
MKFSEADKVVWGVFIYKDWLGDAYFKKEASNTNSCFTQAPNSLIKAS